MRWPFSRSATTGPPPMRRQPRPPFTVRVARAGDDMDTGAADDAAAARRSPRRITAGRFTAAENALAFVGAVLAAGGAAPVCHRAPDHAVWAVTSGLEVAADLVAVTGGTTHRFDDAGTTRSGVSLDAVGSWPAVSTAELVSCCPGRDVAAAPLTGVDVIVAGPLAGPVARQCAAAGAEVSCAVIELRPLGEPSSAPLPGLLVRARAVSGPLRPGLAAGLAALPGCLVCRSATPDGRLLIDVRHRLPVADHHIAAGLPQDQGWALGCHGESAWAFTRAGEFTPLARTLATSPPVPSRSARPLLPALAPLRPPDAEPGDRSLRLVRTTDPSSARVDAMLLADDELEPLRRFLMMRPLGDETFLLAGAGFHLLTEPAGLAAEVPFGVPVRWTGPGALFLESCHRLAPALPPGGRREVFALSAGSVVVFTRQIALRFDAANLLPAWTLWATEAPPLVSGLSARGAELLRRAAEFGEPASPPPAAPAHEDGPLASRGELLRRAQHAELLGDPATAAALLEQAGDLLLAARMYERAAAQHGGAP